MNEIAEYVARNGNHRLLTAEEERTLIVRAQAGDKAARDKIVTHNMRLAIAFARQYHVEANAGIDLTDLMQQAALGLMRAVDMFDVSRGFKFSVFATESMRYLVGRYIENNRYTVRVPVHRQQAGERAEILSLDYESQNDDGNVTTFGESHGTDDAGLAEAEATDFWQTVLSVLSEREAQVIDLRYRQEKQGIEVADILGVTKQRVSQIEKAALAKLQEAQIAA